MLLGAAQFLSRALTPLANAVAGSDDHVLAYFRKLGWALPQVPQVIKDLQSGSSQLVASLARLEAVQRKSTEDGLNQAVAELLLDLGLFISAITRLPSELRAQLPAEFIAATHIDEKIRKRLLDDAIATQLELESPDLYLAAQLLGLVEAVPQQANPSLFQPAFEEKLIRSDRLLLLAGEPAALFREVYGWGTPTLESNKLLVAVRDLCFVLLAPAYFDYSARPLLRVIDPALDDSLASSRGLQVSVFEDPPLTAFLGIYPLPTRSADELQGLVLTLSGLATAQESFDLAPSVALTLKSQIDLVSGVALALWPDRPPKLLGNIGAAASEVVKGANARLEVKYAPSDDTSRLPLLSFDGFKLDVRDVSLEAGIGTGLDAEVEAYVQAGLSRLRLHLDGLTQDSFLAKVLPESVSLEFDLSFGWSITEGLYWQSGSGPKLTIPVGRKIGPFALDSLEISVGSSGEKLQLSFGISVSTKIGPIQGRVDGVGAAITVDTQGGNLGLVDVGFSAAPPRGVGLEINAAAVTGAGFLFLDLAKGQYEGFLQLTMSEFLTVTAVGIITTKLPNGARGFSMVIMITAEGFKPIPLGLGFTLTGIGGLLAINRTCDEEFLRAGIKTNALESLLFPKDPIRNAPQIFGTLNNAFPPRIGSYLFGPVVRIAWGTPPVLTMDVALILELGGRTRLIILGVLKAIMPSEKHDLIRLQMNALGVIDFDQGSISLDAVLYDSRLAGKFPITGSMAMRLRWGSAPLFALSIGGFHPAFKPPANFPVLQRLAISFSNSESFRLRAECYFAITSNTLQFGAKMELYAKAAGFSIVGQIGFDVLIQFDPLFFIADFYASVQLKRGSHNLFKVKVEGKLSGPRPLHVKGKATFEIFWCDFSVRFDKTLVSGDPPPALAPIDVLAQLVAALGDARNWAGSLPESDRRLVTLRDEVSVDHVSYHPLEALSVKQKVVPLGLEIAKFGSSTPAGARRFTIDNLRVSGKETKFDPLLDFFAPAQFLELSDDEKLLAPSFERMTSGISLSREGYVFSSLEADILEDEAITYETIIIDQESEAAGEPTRKASGFSISPELLRRSLMFGAAAQSPVLRTGSARYRPATVKNAPAKKGWTVVSAEDGSPQGAPGLEAGKIVSYSESFQALQKLKQENPARAKTLMLVRISVN